MYTFICIYDLYMYIFPRIFQSVGSATQKKNSDTIIMFKLGHRRRIHLQRLHSFMLVFVLLVYGALNW
jgi:hypothetical protein